MFFFITKCLYNKTISLNDKVKSKNLFTNPNMGELNVFNMSI